MPPRLYLRPLYYLSVSGSLQGFYNGFHKGCITGHTCRLPSGEVGVSIVGKIILSWEGIPHNGTGT